MGRRLLIYVSAAVLIAALILPIQGLAGSDDDPDPQNKLLLDIVFNKESGEMDAGGYTHEELSQLLGPEVLDAIAEGALEYTDLIEHLRLLYGSGSMRLDSLVGDSFQQLISSNWTEEEQDTAFGLMNNMLIENTYYFIPPSNQEMVKRWMDTSIVQVDVRTTDLDKEVSNPLTLVMEAPIQFDIADDNSIAIEGIDLILEPEADKMMRDTAQMVTTMADAAAVDNVVAGWKQGEILLYADGNKLPSITVHEAGLDLLLNGLAGEGVAGQIKPEILYSSTIGVDVSVPGGEHPGIIFAD
jgi:hypothetical protein